MTLALRKMIGVAALLWCAQVASFSADGPSPARAAKGAEPAARPAPPTAAAPAVAPVVGTAAGTAAAAVAGAAAGAAKDISFATLSDFEYELPDPLDAAAKVDLNQVPAAVKALHGQQVAIRGFMLPLDLDQSGVSEFMLNGSQDMCYFGAPVRMNEWILVKMSGAKKARFTHLPVVVSGKLEVGEDVRNGRVMSLYRMTAMSAESDSR